jgi:pre-rRNA-processing protein TSR3
MGLHRTSRKASRVSRRDARHQYRMARVKAYQAMPMPPPITIIVRHPRERVQKCSVWPLRDRQGLLFLEYPVEEMPDLAGYVRLAVDGPLLSAADAASGLLVLDGSWRWTEVMTKAFAHVPPRSLAGWKTAYPRVSKMYEDPAEGLATVEALYLAHHILGRSTEGLLDHYRWAEEFLRRNGFKRN